LTLSTSPLTTALALPHCCHLLMHSLSSLLPFQCSGHPPDPHSFPTRRSSDLRRRLLDRDAHRLRVQIDHPRCRDRPGPWRICTRSEEHTSELQSHLNLVCRLLLEKKKNKQNTRARQRRRELHSITAATDPSRR